MIDLSMLTEQQRKVVPNVTFELVPIKDLVSNQEYQRNLSESHIRKTLEDFDVHQINPVKVSRRDGVLYVFNGQHTIELVAAAAGGDRTTPIWCMVYEMDYETEAHTFSEQQRHVKPLLPYEIFHAHLEAGDSKYLMIQSVVESYGLKVTSSQQTNGVCAVSTLERIFDKYGQETLDSTLRLAVATWEGETNSLSSSMLMGIAKILVSYGDQLKEDIFKDHVGKVSVKSIIRTAKERRPGHMGFAEAMMLAYNNKNKYRLSLRTLYGGKDVDFEEDDAADTEAKTEE